MDLACIGHFNPKNITVRSKSRDLLSTDSVCVPVPVSARRREKPEARGRMGRGRGLGRGMGARRGGRREMVGGQMVIDHDDDNLSDKEVYSKNIPAIGEYSRLQLHYTITHWGFKIATAVQDTAYSGAFAQLVLC